MEIDLIFDFFFSEIGEMKLEYQIRIYLHLKRLYHFSGFLTIVVHEDKFFFF